MSTRSIAQHIVLLVIAAVIPLSGLLAFGIYQRFKEDAEVARNEVLRFAQIAAFDTERLIRNTEATLAKLVTRPQVLALDARQCDPFLADYAKLFPLATNLFTLSADGQIVCSVLPLLPNTPRSANPVYYLDKLKNSRAFTIGAPAIGIITGRWGVTLATPILDERGKVLGMVGMTIDLLKLSASRNSRGLPPLAVAAIINQQGTYITRSLDSEQWVGQRADPLQVLDTAVVGTSRIGQTTSVDGIDRIYAFQAVPGTEWRAVVGIPAANVFALSRRNAWIGAVWAFCTLLLVANLCFLVARRIVRPIKDIAAGAIQAADVHTLVQIPPKGPSEIADLATKFNAMLVARDQANRLMARMAAIVESSDDAIISKDLDGIIVSWNAGAERMFGYTAAEMVGYPVLRLIPPERQHEEALILERVRCGDPVRHLETVRVRKDGGQFDASIATSPIIDAAGHIIGASKVVRDITEQKRAELQVREYAERLRHLSQRLLVLEEEQRYRLGRELHDRTGSNLSALLMSFEVLRRKVLPTCNPELAPQLDDCALLVRETMQHVRDVLAELRPPALDELGLFPALRHHVSLLARRSGQAIQLEGAEPAPRLPSEVEIALFRIAQEALNNACKYAGAQLVTVSLQQIAGQVTLQVADDGCGMVRNSRQPGSDGLGIMTMRERTRAIGANFSITSAPGQGTQIKVELADAPASELEQALA